MTTFLVVMLLILPWIFFPKQGITQQFRLPQWSFLILTFMGTIGIYLSQGNKNVYRNRYLALFIGYLFFHFALNLIVPIGLSKQIGLYMIPPLITIIFGTFFTYILLTNLEKEDFIRIAKALCLSTTFISLFSILQFIGLDPLKSIAHYNCVNVVSACLDNPNLVGMYLAICSALFLYFKKPLFYAGYVLCGIGTAVTGSHFAHFAFAVGLLTYLFIIGTQYLRLGIVGFSAIGCWILYKFDYVKLAGEVGNRIPAWKLGLERLKANPLFGIGLGTTDRFPVHTSGNWGDALWFQFHNDYLQYAVEIGLIGLVLFLFLIINSIRNFSFKERIGVSYFVSFLTFLLFMCGSFPVEIPALGVLGLLSFVAVEKF